MKMTMLRTPTAKGDSAPQMRDYTRKMLFIGWTIKGFAYYERLNQNERVKAEI